MTFEVKSPILGFESTDSVIFTKVDEVFATVRDTKADHPQFTLINPYVLREYSFDIPTPIRILLDLNQDSNVHVYNIMVVMNPIEKSVVNFLAPLVFNENNMTVAQVVLAGRDYPDFGVAEEIGAYLQNGVNAAQPS